MNNFFVVGILLVFFFLVGLEFLIFSFSSVVLNVWKLS